MRMDDQRLDSLSRLIRACRSTGLEAITIETVESLIADLREARAEIDALKKDKEALAISVNERTDQLFKALEENVVLKKELEELRRKFVLKAIEWGTPGLSFSEYQERARATAQYPKEPKTIAIAYCALGLNGEAGEVAEQVKKALRDDSGVFTPERKATLRKEIGDVLWYASQLAYELGEDLEEIAAENLEKLADRIARGVIKGSGNDR